MRNVTRYISAFLLAVLSTSVLLFGLSVAYAQPAYTMNYQGKLTNNSGLAVTDGTYAIEFKLYTQSSGGVAVWTETRTGGNEVTVTNGLFSVMLGSVTSLSGVNFNQPLYLGVKVESDSEMTPRKALGTVPSAFEARQLGGVASTSFLRSDAVDTASGLLTFTGGIISTASSSISRATFVTATTTNLAINNERFTDLTGTGLVNTGGVLSIATSSLGLLASGDINTSAELAGILTDETGTAGSVVFSASPTLTGTLTAAAADFSGIINLGGASYISSNGTFRSISGTVSSPAYSFENDTDTGWYNPGDGAIRFSSNNSDAFSIISGGNIGVGTTTPSQRFTVGATAGSQFLVSSSGVISDGTWQGDIIADAYINDTLTIGAGSTFANNIITPDSILSTSQTDEYCLTYETGDTFEWQTCGSGGSSTFLGLTDTPSAFTAFRIPYTNSGATALVDASDFLFNDSTDRLTVGTATFGATGMSFVGAATTTVPNNNAYAFTIATSTTARPLFRVDTTSGGESVSIGTVGGDVFIGGVGSASNLVFEEASTISGQGTNLITLGVSGDRFNVVSGAKFGIATTTPWQEFSVNGDIALTGRIYDSVASAGTNGMVLQTTGSATRWVATSSLGFLSASNFDTSAELAGILTDETGFSSGALSVFSISPVITGTADFVAGDFSSTLTMSGSAANIALGSNYINGDADDEGLSVSTTGVGTITRTSGSVANSFSLNNTSTGVGSGNRLTFQTSGTTDNAMISQEITSSGNSDLYFTLRGSNTLTERMRITAGGNVGIGTTSPYAKLSVVGDVAARNFIATSTTATSTFSGGFVVANSSTGFIAYPNGRVGIGQLPATTNQLSVSGSSLFSGFLAVARSSTQSYSGSFTNSASGGSVVSLGGHGAAAGLLVAGGTSNATTTQFNIGTAAQVGLVIQGASAQSADLMRWQSSAGTVLGLITSGGDLRITTAGTNSASVVTVGGTQTLTNKTWNGAAIGIAYGGLGAAFTDPNADQIMFWDDSLGAITGISTITGGSITGTTLTIAVGASEITDDSITFADINMTAAIGSDPAFAANDTFFGSTGVIFEGGTADAFEGLLTSAVATSDKTWTLPNTTGTLITTGDTGTVSNTMLANSSISLGGVSISLGGTNATPAFTLTNATGLPISTGVSGLGTGVATALGVNIGTAGSFVTNGGALGTPSSGTLTNASGLPIVGGTTGTLTETRGGTNQTTYATGDMLYASGANTLAKRTIGSTGQLLSVSGGVPTWISTSTLNLAASALAVDSLDFAQFDDTLDLDANTTINADDNASQFGLSFVSDLSVAARSTAVLSLTQANNVTNNFTGTALFELTNNDTGSSGSVLYLDQNSTSAGTAALTIGAPATAVTYGINISGTVTDGAAIYIPAVSAGYGIDTNIALMTSGAFIRSQGASSGTLTAFTGDFIFVSSGRTHTGATTISDTGNYIDMQRTSTVNNAGGTVNVTGDLATLTSTLVETAGTITDSSNILSLAQNCGTNASCTGSVLELTNAGTGHGADFFMTNTSGVQANGVYVRRNGSGGTTTNGIQIAADAGTLTTALLITDGAGTIGTGIQLTGTFGTALLDTPSLDISASGAVTGAASYNGLVITADTGAITTGTWTASVISSTYLDTAVILSTEIDTSAELAGILGDETGFSSGALAVFSISPVITGTADFVAGDFSSTLTMSGSAANIALGSNFLSGDGGDEGVYVDASGNVGIGDSTPSGKLTFANNLATGFLDNYTEYQAIFYDSGTAGNTYGVGVKADTLVFNSGTGAYSFDRAGSATTMTLTTAGNIGIGTTTPNQALSIFRSAADSAIEFSTVSGTAEKWTIGIDDSDAAKFKISSSSVLGTNDRFVIDGGGKVGIGTSNPATQLDLVNSTASQIGLRITAAAAQSNNIFDIRDSSNNSKASFGPSGTLALSSVPATVGVAASSVAANFNSAYWNGSASVSESIFIQNARYGGGGGSAGAYRLAIGSSNPDNAALSVAGDGSNTVSVNYPYPQSATDAQFYVVSSAATKKGLVVVGATSQSDSLLELQNSGGTSLFTVNSSGVISTSNNITPNSILSTGQTDEYCLTYEGTGTTFEWQTCSSGGGLASTDIDTSAELAGILTDETGFSSGALAVFSISPVITGTADFVAGDFSSTLTMSGSAANISLGSNYLSGDGGDEGVFVDGSGNVGIGTSTPAGRLSTYFGSTNTTGTTDYGNFVRILDTGVVTTGSDNVYGTYTDIDRSGSTGGTVSAFGSYVNISGDGGGAGTLQNLGYAGALSGGDSIDAVYFNIDADNVNSVSGTDIRINSTVGAANTIVGQGLSITDSSVVTTGSDFAYGESIYVERTSATGGAIANYGSEISVTGSFASGSGTIDNYGAYITVAGTTAGTSVNRGLYVNVSGADTNYSGIFLGGSFGLGDATPDSYFDIDTPTTYTSGTIYQTGAAGATTLAGALTGMNLNLSTNYTATGQSVTGYTVTLPAVTNTGASTYNYRGLNVTGSALTQNTGAGTTAFRGSYITNANITQTTGTVSSYGTEIVTGTNTTGGTQGGVLVTATGVGAGSLFGLNIANITGAAGTETAVNIGSGWDNAIVSTGFTLNGAGTITSGTWNGTVIDITRGGLGAAFTDPNADQIMFWDDSLGAITGISTITGGSITGTTLTIAVGASEITDDSITFADINMTAAIGSDPAFAANDTFFGSTGVIFEGGTADAFEGLLTSAVATSDKTWTLPNTTGTLITNGDTGTVTNTMLAGSIAASKLTGTDIATVGTITSGTWGASFSNNVVTPNAVFTTGQTDEYCLTYEATGTTWEWQSCAGGGMSIGGSITSATQGSVLFAGASGVLQQDNASLFFDDTNNRLGIGTTTPTAKLDVGGVIRASGITAPTSAAGLELSYWSSASTGYVGTVNRSTNQNLNTVIYGSTVSLGVGAAGGAFTEALNIGSDRYVRIKSQLNLETSTTTGPIVRSAQNFGVTLTGALTGYDMDLRSNYTLTNQSITGLRTQTANVTNTGASTYNNYLIDLGTSGATFAQSTAAGTSNWRGINITAPNITQTTGTVVASGAVLTTGTITTGGTQNGLNVVGQGVGAGTLNAINIANITSAAGTENAINVGTGYDNILNTTPFDIAGTGATTIAPLTTFTTGTLISAAAGGATTLSGAYTGMDLNLSTNYTATGQNVTGYSTTLPAVTNTGAGTYAYRGLNITGNALTQNTGAGASSFYGMEVTTANITQTTGTVTSGGVLITTGTNTTGGAQYGIRVVPSGVSAGNLYGIRLGAITAGAGTETALTVGSGWDTILDSASLDITGAGAITGATGFNGMVITADTGVVTTGTWNAGVISSTYLDTATILSTEIDTSAELAAILGDETGTGAVVFSGSPTFTGTVNAAAATLSSTLTMSGSAANIALGSNYLSGDGGDEGVFVDASGNVGIGNTSPNGKLQVTTTDDTTPNTVTAWDARHFVVGQSANTGGVGISYNNTSGYGVINAVSPSVAWRNLVLQSGGGNVGIGDTSPASLFTVGSGDLFQVNSSGQVVAGTWQGTAVTSTYLDTSVILSTEIDTSAELAAILGDETGTAGSVVFSASPTFTGTISGAAITASGNITLSGSAANILLGSNFLSGDGGDEGISVDSSGNVGALQDQFSVCSGGACASTANGDGTITAERAITSEESTVTAGAGITLNWDDGNQQYLVLTTNSTIGSFSNNTTGQTLRLVVCQDGTGGRTFTFSPTIKWSGGTTPTQTSTLNKCDVYSFIQTTAGTLGSFNQNF